MYLLCVCDEAHSDRALLLAGLTREVSQDSTDVLSQCLVEGDGRGNTSMISWSQINTIKYSRMAKFPKVGHC